jgi:hypothetical protein
MAYDVACTLFGHGNDTLQRKPVPKGCCVVTGVLCGDASLVEVNLKAINKVFKQNDVETQKYIVNPRTYQKELEKSLGFEIHIAEGDKGEEANLFDFQLFMEGENDDSATSWLVRSGLYEYPIKTRRRFIIGEEIDTSDLKISDLELAFEESLYPTIDQLKAVLPKKKKLSFKEIDDLIEEHFHVDSNDVLKRYQDKGKRVVFYNFVCRSQGVSEFQMELRSQSKVIAALRRKSLNQNLAGRLRTNAQKNLKGQTNAEKNRRTRKNRR